MAPGGLTDMASTTLARVTRLESWHRGLAVIALALAFVAWAAAIVSRLYEPHYAGPADLPDPGFNTWYWHAVDHCCVDLPVAAFAGGIATFRRAAGRAAFGLAIVE